MSKAAMNSMQCGIVEEFCEQGIRMNAVSPGVIKTDMVSDSTLQKCIPTIPMRYVTPKLEFCVLSV